MNQPQTQNHHSLQWLDYLKQQGKSDHTIKAYRLAYTHFSQWYKDMYGEPLDPAATLARDIRDWKSYQQSVEKTAPSTINQRLVGLSSFYKWATVQDHVRRDPTVEVKTLPLAKRQPKSLSSKTLRRLLRTVHNNHNLRDIAIVELLAGTGIRVGELLALQVGDIVVHDRSGWVTIREGKHGHYREVPLTRDVRRALQEYLNAHSWRQERYPDYRAQNTPLWLGKQGALTHRSSILRIINKYTLQARLEPIGPHVFRHTFATLYLKANPNDLRGLAALLGHSDLNTVMIYTEPTLDDLTERMERVAGHG